MPFRRVRSAVPRDHFAPYKFHDKKLGKLAKVARDLEATNFVLGNTITPVGSPVTVAAGHTLSFTPTAVNNVVVVCIGDYNRTTASISATGGLGFNQAVYQHTSGGSIVSGIFWGQVSALGASTITYTNNGGVYTYSTMWAQEFSAGVGGSPYNFGAFGTWQVMNTAVSGAISSGGATGNYASLTSNCAGQLYVTTGFFSNSGASGSTSGFIYDNSFGYNNEVSVVYNSPSNSAAGAFSPAWSGYSGAGACGNVSFLLSFTLISAIPNTGSQSQGSATVSFSPTNIGDLAILWGAYGGNAHSITSVSGGGVTTWNQAASATGSQAGNADLWWGIVTSTGTFTITVTNAATTYTYQMLCTQAFGAGLGTWSLDKHGILDVEYTTTNPVGPSLTPTNNFELYVAALNLSNANAFVNTNPSPEGTFFTEAVNIETAISYLWVVYQVYCASATTYTPTFAVNNPAYTDSAAALFIFTPRLPASQRPAMQAVNRASTFFKRLRLWEPERGFLVPEAA